jgi:hypothetical protein
MAKFKIEVLGERESIHDNVIAKNMESAIQLVLASLPAEQRRNGPLDLIIMDKTTKPYRVHIRKIQS